MRTLLVNFTEKMVESLAEPLEDLNIKTFISDENRNVINDIATHKIQTIIINWPDENSDITSLCKRIKKTKHAKDVFILIIASQNNYSHIGNALNAGADDFILKPFSRDELYLRLMISKKVSNLYKTVSKSQKSVLKLAKEDPQTNLLNRRSLLDRALKEMGRASRKHFYLCSVLISIVNYQDIAQKLDGNEINEFFAEFSRRLLTSCRPYDMIGRYSINEFLLFLPDVTAKDSKKIAERVLDTVARHPFIINNNKISINLAIGISELDPEDVAKTNKIDDKLMNDLILDSLVRRSEFALGNASKSGKNNIAIYSFS